MNTMNPAEILQRAQEKYREQLRSYGNGKRKTPEQVYEDIWNWKKEEERKILEPYERKLVEWQKNPFKPGRWHKGPITNKSYKPRPRKSKRMKEELEEVFRTFKRKMKRLRTRHPEWRVAA